MRRNKTCTVLNTFCTKIFNADLQASNPDNPRLIFGKDSDFFLSEIADHPAGTYQISDCTTYEKFFVSQMIRIGILRSQNGALLFDCPIFLAEDADTLQQKTADSAVALADILEGAVPAIRDCCAKIDNQFSVEQNLYHILCGMIFDGLFFDFLSEHRSLATSRTHPSGLDYLVIIYEKCDSLQKFSDQILCSYNRFANQRCSLQSFGDAQGNRFDFYRFFSSDGTGKTSRPIPACPNSMAKQRSPFKQRKNFCLTYSSSFRQVIATTMFLNFWSYLGMYTMAQSASPSIGLSIALIF